MQDSYILLIAATASLIFALAAYVRVKTEQLKDGINTANEQLKEVNKQLTTVVKQNSLAANPSNPRAADAEHAVNTAADKAAAEPK